MKVAVLVFPGSNSDHDAYHAVKHVCGHEARFVWHKDGSLGDAEAVIVPGGFSYGDYLRSGAIARFAPVMAAVAEFAKRGGPVLGICNGFQILQEAGLLPGAMLRNRSVKFLSQQVHVRVERGDTAATAGLAPGTVLSMPIAHGEGNFHAEADELDRLEQRGQVVFRYVECVGGLGAEELRSRRSPHGTGDGFIPAPEPDSRLSDAANPNGSARAIAGVCNEGRNVVGLMPHPERASEAHLHHGAEGRLLLTAFLESAVRA